MTGPLRRGAGPAPAIVAIVAILALALAACRGSGGGLGPSRPAASTGPPSPSRSPFSQEFDNGDPCPTGHVDAVPAGAGCVTTAEGDLDGDGTADRFLVYARLDTHHHPTSWWVRADVGGKPTPALPIPFGAKAGGVADVYPRAVGAVDANGDGRDEVLVKLAAIIYHVAGQRILGMFAVDGGRIEPVTLPNGRTLTFVTGGIASLGQGATCLPDADPPAFVITRAQKIPEHWKLVRDRYTWNGEQLVGPTVTVRTLPFDTDFTDPRILPSYGISCGTVHSVS